MTDTPTSAGHAAVVATSVAVAAAGAGLFTAFCPTWYDMRTEEHSDLLAHRRAIRHGYGAAAALTLAQGYASAALLRNALPLLSAMLVTAVEISGYEWWLRRPAGQESGPAPSWQRALMWGAAGAGA